MDHASELQVASDVPAAMTQPAAAEVTAAAVPKSVERRRNWFELLAAPAIALPLLTAMGLLLYFVNLGGYPLYTKGEPREAVTVVNMMAGGGVILPLRAGIEVPSKPLLMHWLAALLSLYAGHVDEWTVRLPSAIFSLLGLLACYWYVRRLFDQTAALISALVLGTTIQYLQAGTGARVDMTLSFFLEIAFFEFLLMAEGLTKRRMLLYAAVSCAALGKGPIGIVLPAAVAGIWILLERRWDIVGDIKIARGAALIAMMVGGWYVAATIEGGSGFLRKQILRENIFTFFYDPNLSGGHSHPFYYVELALLAGFLPWSTLLPFAAAEGLPKIKRINPRTAYLLVWLATVLLFYSMAHSKRGVYLLAVYPALATLLALALSDLFKARIHSLWIEVAGKLFGTACLFGGAAALFAIASLRFWPVPLTALLKAADITASGFVPALRNTLETHVVIAVLSAGLIAGIGSYLLRTDATVEKVVTSVAAAVALIAVSANLFVTPAMANTLSLKQFTAEATKVIGGRSVGYGGALNYDFAFYSGRTIPIISIYDPRLPDYLLIWSEVYNRLAPADRQRFTIVLQSGATELDGSGGMTLMKPAYAGTAGKP